MEVPEKKILRLPHPSFPDVSFPKVLLRRRSRRDFKEVPLELEKFSAVLFSAQGITGEKYGFALRTAPSAGATYPVDLVVFARNVEGVEKGLWLYIPENHSIRLIKKGNFSAELSEIAVGQDEPERASTTLIMIGVVERIFPRYAERSLRYIFLECGHISQNVYLMSEALGLGSVSIGAFYDDELAKLAGYNPKEVIAAYMHAVGYTRD